MSKKTIPKNPKKALLDFIINKITGIINKEKNKDQNKEQPEPAGKNSQPDTQNKTEKCDFKECEGGKTGGENAKLKPGTPKHKADRWEKYKKRGGKYNYERWSKQYDTNMQNYKHGLKRESDYRKAMEASEGTLKTPLTKRQIDILKAKDMYAGQLKTGPVSLTKKNVIAIQKDAELVKRGWEVEHVLEKGASKPYIKALEKAGIKYHIGSKIPK